MTTVMSDMTSPFTLTRDHIECQNIKDNIKQLSQEKSRGLTSQNIKDNIKQLSQEKSRGLTSSAATLTLGPEKWPLGHIIEIHINIPQMSM